jgi:PAS domain S-box-containing protein
MKKLKDKTNPSIESESNLFQQETPYEIVFANPRDEEINLKFLKKSQITAHMARWFLDHEYNQLIWSDGVFEILELDARRYGANFDSFLEMVHPEDRELKNQTQENLQTTFKPIEINYRLQFSDGRIKWINEICNTDFDQEGNAIRSYGTLQDITKYKVTEENFRQKEEQLQSLIEAIPTGIAIIQNDEFVFVNPSARRIFGGNSEISFKGKSISNVLRSKSKDYLSGKLKSINKGNLEPTFEETLIRADGSVFDAEITLIKIPFLGSSAVQLIINDITDRKKVEDALQKNEEKFRLLAASLSENEDRLKNLVATKDKFFSIIAHDLRSPFNSIIGFLDLLQNQFESFSDIEKRSYLNLIERDTKRTLKLLDNLLEWAKFQTGKISFEPQKQILLPILKNVEETLESSLQLKLLKLNLDEISDQLEVCADTNMLTTIFRNLISNAIKYSHPEGTITVSAVLHEDSVEITVSDTGIGMSEETKNSIFIINGQVSIPGTENEVGSGLGLILCKDFVERHDGEIWVESEIGKGTKVGFTIPLLK